MSDVFHCYDQRIQGSRVRSISSFYPRRGKKNGETKLFKSSESDFLPQEKSTFDLILFPAKKVPQFTIFSQTHKLDFAFFVMVDKIRKNIIWNHVRTNTLGLGNF